MLPASAGMVCPRASGATAPRICGEDFRPAIRSAPVSGGLPTLPVRPRAVISEIRRDMSPSPAIVPAAQTKTLGAFGVTGPADILKAAFETAEPVSLGGEFSGERVYLGHVRQTYGDYGITPETVGLDRELTDGGAVYLINLNRLDEAPRLARQIGEEQDERTENAMLAERRANADEERYLNPDYD